MKDLLIAQGPAIFYNDGTGWKHLGDLQYENTKSFHAEHYCSGYVDGSIVLLESLTVR